MSENVEYVAQMSGKVFFFFFPVFSFFT